jgi:hypothetical protein
VVKVTQDEIVFENKRRDVQRLYEAKLKEGEVHTRGEGALPVGRMPAVVLNRPEGEIAFASRTTDWRNKNQKLWNEIAQICEGGAFLIAQTAGDGDGKLLWGKLEARFGTKSISPKMDQMDKLLSIKHTSGGIQQRVSAWKRTIQNLALSDIVFDKLM